MRNVRYIFGLCAVFTLIGIFSAVNAQTTASNIEGIVTDQNGAVIAGATVKASGVNVSAERSAVTDNEGSYRLVALPAGTYNLTVSQTGFATRVFNIELTLNRVAKFDAQLSVGGGVAGEVTVTSELPLLEPTASSTGPSGGQIAPPTWPRTSAFGW